MAGSYLVIWAVVKVSNWVAARLLIITLVTIVMVAQDGIPRNLQAPIENAHVRRLYNNRAIPEKAELSITALLI